LLLSNEGVGIAVCVGVGRSCEYVYADSKSEIKNILFHIKICKCWQNFIVTKS